MKIIFIFLMLVCLTSARTTKRNENVMRKMKLLQPLLLRFPSFSSTEGRRQSTPENDGKCNRIRSNATCSSSYAQNYINGIAKCGDRAKNDINVAVNSCGRDKTGEYCGTLFSNGYFGHCSGSSCLAACSTFLKQADCCLNMTYYYYSQYLHLCGLPSPSPCDNSDLQIPNIIHDPTCTSTKDYEITQIQLSCGNAQPIIDALNMNSCTDYSQNIIDVCSSRNGQYCFIELNITGDDSVGIQLLQKAGQMCPTNSSCSSQCRSSLTAVVDTIGCCFHTANATLNYFDEYGAIFKGSLWDTCGLQIPKHCSSPFINNINTFMY